MGVGVRAVYSSGGFGAGTLSVQDLVRLSKIQLQREVRNVVPVKNGSLSEELRALAEYM